jgi:hypothetical protein
LTCPLQDAGSVVHVSPPHDGLPAHTGSAQHVGSPQSLALHGQHSTVPGNVPIETPCVPAGHVATSPSPVGHEHDGSVTLHVSMHAGDVAHENTSKQPGR